MSQTLEVRLSSQRYPIHFGSFASAGIETLRRDLEREARPEAALIDRTVATAAASLVARHFGGIARLELPAGENTKAFGQLGDVWHFLAKERIDRRGVLWVIGGGVIGDLGGFAAATYLRGIDYVQVPTTLLAMVDSSVGGKTGINIEAGKNLVGAFHHPRAVFILPDFLASLPRREFAAGMAEVIKYGMLGDADLFSQLATEAVAAGDARLPAVIRRCCEMKAAIVQADEREMAAEDGRALLNLGHTFGHAIEKVAGYGSYVHGEAVAIGLAAAIRTSVRLGMVNDAAVVRVEDALSRHHLPVRLREPLPLRALMEAMKSDKKVRAGRLRLVLLRRLGDAFTQEVDSMQPVEAVWRDLGATG